MFVTNLLSILSNLERKIHYNIFWALKIYILKKMLMRKDFIDNNVSNIICSKIGKFTDSKKIIEKLTFYGNKIYCVSPRSLVCCVLNKNTEILKYLKENGYPLEEIIKYADNYYLIHKKRLNYLIS
jgi:hypothetical protein